MKYEYDGPEQHIDKKRLAILEMPTVRNVNWEVTVIGKC